MATGRMLNVQVVIDAKKLAIDLLYLCNSLSIGLLFRKIPIAAGWNFAGNIAVGCVYVCVCIRIHPAFGVCLWVMF